MPEEHSQLPLIAHTSQVASQKVSAQGVDSTLFENEEDNATAQAAINEDSDRVNKSDKGWLALFDTAPEIIRHTIALLLSLFSLWLIHLALKHILGDPKFFGVIPVQWIIDVGDIIILIKFIWHLIKNFNK